MSASTDLKGGVTDAWFRKDFASKAKQFMPKSDCLPFHFEDLDNEKRLVCWVCHPGGVYNREVAAQKDRFRGVFRTTTTKDELHPLKCHLSKHGGKKKFPVLLDMTAEMEKFSKYDREIIDCLERRVSEEKAKLLAARDVKQNLGDIIKAKDDHIAQLERRIGDLQQAMSSRSERQLPEEEGHSVCQENRT